VDFGAAVKRSRDIVGRQTKGVGFLMKKNKIDVIDGQASFHGCPYHAGERRLNSSAEAEEKR
jgi:pyruvate/2-oxoglutarate dehydrogenase complex dihydrolipoamide dehydrogenase (E3) component